MGTTINGVYEGGRQKRRENARILLEEQLKRGTKPRKNGRTYSSYNEEEVLRDEHGKAYAIKLSPKDIKRIEKDIETLKTR